MERQTLAVLDVSQQPVYIVHLVFCVTGTHIPEAHWSRRDRCLSGDKPPLCHLSVTPTSLVSFLSLFLWRNRYCTCPTYSSITASRVGDGLWEICGSTLKD